MSMVMSLITPFLVFKDVPCSPVHFPPLTQSDCFSIFLASFKWKWWKRTLDIIQNPLDLETTVRAYGPSGSVVKRKKKKIHLPMQETRVWSLGPEDPLEKEMATHSSILTWKIPWTEEPGGLQSVELQKSWTQLSTTGTVRACCRLFSGQRQQVFAFYKDEMYRDTPNSNSRPQDFSFL